MEQYVKLDEVGNESKNCGVYKRLRDGRISIVKNTWFKPDPTKALDNAGREVLVPSSRTKAIRLDWMIWVAYSDVKKIEEMEKKQ